jgi:UDP-N-acetylglucosamine 3-dehydrogenase
MARHAAAAGRCRRAEPVPSPAIPMASPAPASDASSSAPMRGAVLGLGMIGRHHARILQSSPQSRLVGAVDEAGDRHDAVQDPDLLFSSLDELLGAGAPDFAVVALPTEEHATAVAQLAEAGVHVLIEKPLAPTVAEGEAIIAACERHGVRAAVGHVERFNPALRELRRRLGQGQLGEVYLVATQRVGPFPDRVRDVGVVKDLATHDLDLVGWLGGSGIDTVAAQTSHKMGREHEDLVLITGRLRDGITFNCMVDWLTPTKVRQTRVLGEAGMLVADTLTADLTFYENGTISSEWEGAQALRGVSEGDATRYALARREPLRVELEEFCAFAAGDDGAEVVTLTEGLRTVACAEAVLRSAQSGDTERMDA